MIVKPTEIFTSQKSLSKLVIIFPKKFDNFFRIIFRFLGLEGLPDDSYRNLIMQMAPHYWPASTMQFFPPILTQLYSAPNMTAHNGSTSLASRQPLRAMVEQDYLTIWRSSLFFLNLKSLL